MASIAAIVHKMFLFSFNSLSNPDFWVYYEQVEENGL